MFQRRNLTQGALSAEQELAIGHLSFLQIVCDRLSHTIRTPLGVSMGVVDDLLADFKITPTDLHDAKDALQTIHRVLNDIREFSNFPAFEPRGLNICDKLNEWAEGKFGLDSYGVMIVVGSSEQFIAEVDEKLLWRAIRALIIYLKRKWNVFKKESDNTDVILELQRMGGVNRSGCSTNAIHLRIALAEFEPESSALSTERKSLKALLERDHSPESLSLLFAEGIIALHHANAECEFHNKVGSGLVTAFNIYL